MPSLSLKRASAESAADLALVERAGTFADIVATTYVPARAESGAASARVWMSEREVYAIAVEESGVSAVAGMIALRTPVDAGVGVTIPDGAAEWELFLYPEWRHKGLARAALLSLCEQAVGRYRALIGVSWADNHASIRLSESAGAQHLGRSYWTGPQCAGFCEVYLLPVAATRR